MINPFEYKDKFSSPEMKALMIQLKELTAKICLQYAEENGEQYNDALIHQTIDSQVQFATVAFKLFADSELSRQIKTPLSDDDKIAIAAHQAYKEVLKIGQN